jgi:hypothetical protein
MRRSAKTAAEEDELEVARAAAEVSERLFARAADKRIRDAVGATVLGEEYTFTPFITAKAANFNRITYPTALPIDPATGAATGSHLERTMLLYGHAQALAAKRAQEAENSITEDPNCTFHPAIRSPSVQRRRQSARPDLGASALSTGLAAAGAAGHADSAANGEGASVVGSVATAADRLYSNAKVFQQKQEEKLKEALRAAGTFHPTLNPRSLAIAKRPRSASVASRPRLHELRPEKAPEALVQRKIQQEMAGCTFKPAITDKGHKASPLPKSLLNAVRLDGLLNGTDASDAENNLTAIAAGDGSKGGSPSKRVPVFEAMYAVASATEAKLAARRAQLAEAQSSAFSFHPAVDKRSEKLARRGRSRSLGPAGEGERERGSAAAAAAPDAAGTAAEISLQTAHRLYANAADIAARLEAKRQELAAVAAAPYTFRPAIDPHSRLMTLSTKRFNSSGALVAAAGGRSSLGAFNGHPQRAAVGDSPLLNDSRFSHASVWDRLYADKDDFEAVRQRAIAEAVDKEMAAATFTPEINDRSRRMAEAADKVLAALAAMHPSARAKSGEGAQSHLLQQQQQQTAEDKARAAVWDRLYAKALTEPEMAKLRAEVARRIEMRECTFQPTVLPASAKIAARRASQDASAIAHAAGGGSPSLGEQGGEGAATHPGRRFSITKERDGAGPAGAASDIWSQLASERKDVAKLEAIKAKLELAQCTFTPNITDAQPAIPAPVSSLGSPGGDNSSATASSFSNRRRSAAGSRANLASQSFASPPVSGARPTDLFDRIVAEVQAETVQEEGSSLAGSTKRSTERRASVNRSKSPVFDRYVVALRLFTGVTSSIMLLQTLP